MPKEVPDIHLIFIKSDIVSWIYQLLAQPFPLCYYFFCFLASLKKMSFFYHFFQPFRNSFVFQSISSQSSIVSDLKRIYKNYLCSDGRRPRKPPCRYYTEYCRYKKFKADDSISLAA